MNEKAMAYRDILFSQAENDFTNAVLHFRAELQEAREDKDPSHQSPEYKAWRAGEIRQKHILKIRAAIVPYLEQGHRVVTAAKSQYDRAVQEHERSFDPARVQLLKSEYVAQIATGGTATADSLKAEVMQSGDAHKARALRAALLETNGQFAKDFNQTVRLWANRQKGEVERWAENDESQEIKEARNQYNSWAQKVNAAGEGIAELGREIEAPAFMRDGVFNDLLGIPSVTGEVVITEKSEALSVQG